jgi:hypothetical protein
MHKPQCVCCNTVAFALNAAPRATDAALAAAVFNP